MKKNLKQTSPQTEPISLIKIVLRRWGFYAGVAGILVGGAAAASTLWIWEPIYEAKQFIRVIQNREYTDIIEDGRGKVDPKSVMAPVRTELLLSPLLTNAEVLNEQQNLDLEQLRKMVRYEGGGEHFRIVVTGESPKLAKVVAENLAKDFVDFHQQDRTQKLAELTVHLDKEINSIEDELDTIAKKLADQNASRLAPTGNQPVDRDGSYFAEILKSLYLERLEQSQISEELASWKKTFENIEDEYDNSAIVEMVLNSPAVIQLDRRLEEQIDTRKSQSRLGSSHPSMANLERQIDETRTRRKKEVDRQFQVQKTIWLADRKKFVEGKIGEFENQVKRHQLKIDAYQKEANSLAENQKETSQREFEFKQTLDQQMRLKDRHAEWLAKRSRITSKNLSLHQVAIEGPESVATPTSPVERYPIKLLAMAGLAGFGLPFVLATIWELRIQRISSFDQIKNQVRVELLGEVANLPVRSSRVSTLTSKRVTKQLRLYEESVDNLSAIIANSDKDLPVVFSVTSACSNEGKTTLASQLAISSARSNLGRTLLIDADMRSPSLHRLFGGTLEIGLGDVLTGSVTLDHAIVETNIDNLDMLTAGKLRTNPRRYFSGDDWTILLDEAREIYDHIIVDTPPVLAASESLAISKQCDYSLMCVLRDVSRADSVSRAHERLLAAEINVLGCAFGGVPQNEYANKYGSYEYNMS